MHLDPVYADKIYGRTVPEPDGRTTLQYWFFYYFNWYPLLPGGDHEGDWEMVQVELDSSGIPIRTAYAQHHDGHTCPWPLVEKTSVGAPVVYVAKGTHASYYSAGFKSDNLDEVGGQIPVSPSVVEIDPPGPSWLDWPGRWGDEETGSPVGPAQKGTQWLQPATWADGLETCLPESALHRADTSAGSTKPGVVPPRPPAPTVVATRVGKRVRVAYSFSVWPRNSDRRPIMLLTAVQAANPRYTPFTKRHRITARRGVVTQPLGLGPAPFKLHAAAYSKAGRSSKTVTVRVGTG
jgi:hypothetical protein